VDPRASRRSDPRPRKFFAEVREQLIAFADHQFLLSRPAGDGQPQRAHIEAAAAQGSVQAALDLQGPELPHCAAHVWDWYCELSAATPSTGMGPGVLTHLQVESWCRLRRIALRAVEIDWLFALDVSRLTEYARREEQKQAKPPAKGAR